MSDQEQKVHLLGIRHHGPGSARSVARALAALKPDCVLVEGPPEADALVPLFADPQMKPPIALLMYDPTEPRRAVFDPFAVYSPEWQAIRYALANETPVRFMDLPQANRFALTPPDVVTEDAAATEGAKEEPAAPDEAAVVAVIAQDVAPEAPQQAEGAQEQPTEDIAVSIARDPLRWVAEAAGFSDGERWWERMVETRGDSADIFAAIIELMTALREKVPAAEPLENMREAHMRKTIRAALKEGFSTIAVICGAWHTPALVDLSNAKADTDLLRDLAKNKVEATIVPWTYGRLTMSSGYGAGVASPGWYQHLWDAPTEATTYWLARVARLLREEDLDASSAQVIDAVRLAETLASLRGAPLPGLPELNESCLAVFCNGNDAPMRLIEQRLVIGNVLGEVPEKTPSVPLVADLNKEQKRLRLKPSADSVALDLDLRKDIDLGRSQLLHRLALLDVDWGQMQSVGHKKGTFHEMWNVAWRPELAVALVIASRWGVTIENAAAAFISDAAQNNSNLPALTSLVERALLADLPAAVAQLMAHLASVAAISTDTGHLMDALPPLVNVLRYGNVRQTDTAAVGQVVDGLVARICIGLPNACSSLDDDAAEAMFVRIMAVQEAIMLLQNDAYKQQWRRTLQQLVARSGLHGLIAGRACRLLLDSEVFSPREAARRLGLALSQGSDPALASAWIDGFLRGGGIVLLHDNAVWQAVDDWLSSLNSDAFIAILPLLRRTFSTFTPPERRQMGQRAAVGNTPQSAEERAERFDAAQAGAVLPLLAQLLGVGSREPGAGL